MNLYRISPLLSYSHDNFKRVLKLLQRVQVYSLFKIHVSHCIQFSSYFSLVRNDFNFTRELTFYLITHNNDLHRISFMYFFPFYVTWVYSILTFRCRGWCRIFDYQISDFKKKGKRQTELLSQKTILTSLSKVKKESDESNKQGPYPFRLVHIHSIKISKPLCVSVSLVFIGWSCGDKGRPT